MLEDPLRSLLDAPEVLLGPDVAVSLAEIDGRPVAGALSVLLGDEPNGYVGWVSCLPEGRGRHLGDHVTRLVTNEAFARGASIVTLEASRFGENTYRRMGYEERYRYRMMIKL
jgi:ribosomal protein S18 acetylase RimI-like enzyme